jgi:hypothetical protein
MEEHVQAESGPPMEIPSFVSQVASTLRVSPPPTLDVKRLLFAIIHCLLLFLITHTHTFFKSRCMFFLKCVHSGQLEVAKKRPAAAKQTKSAETASSVQRPVQGSGDVMESDLLALRNIPELDIDSHLVTGKKSCTILFGVDGRVTRVKSECLFNLCVNLGKRSFWIYGGFDHDGTHPSKRNHSWAKTSVAAAWKDAHACVAEHFKVRQPQKRRR